MQQNTVNGIITEINGPIIKAGGMDQAGMLDVVLVGNNELVGEIIRLDKDIATIQVYEENSMMKVGERAISYHRPLSVHLGPGILTNIYDGIQRPLPEYDRIHKYFIKPGAKVKPLNLEKKWHFTPVLNNNDTVSSGLTIGYVQETELINHSIMVPPNTLTQKLTRVEPEGDYTIEDPIATLENGQQLTMAHYWPVRTRRPYMQKLSMNEPLITGQRVIDVFFPIAKGGAAAIPGGFGTGKTMTQHSLAKWSDANIIVYIGCGERGNEMTDVLTEFPELLDPKSGLPLMKRTVLIANTSNMPVAAREVSIYTGITIAEYFRDMGYDVAVMADSTSRWAEALRELSGRLEEMPADEGYPAYLPTRLAEFYERAGRIKTFEGKNGSVSIIGAVSPPGGDFSEPVTQHTKRFIRCFWGLDKSLANARHYPAISWLDSYSEYVEEIKNYWNTIEPDWESVRNQAIILLKREEKLAQIVKLVGPDALPDIQRIILFTTDLIKKGFLQQNAFHDIDMYSCPEKQILLLKLIIHFYNLSVKAIEKGVPLIKIRNLSISSEILKIKFSIENDNTKDFQNYFTKLEKEFNELLYKYN